jgi:hypothetical protein
MQDTAVMRIVVRNGFSLDLAGVLIDDFRRQVKTLEMHPQQPIPLVAEAARESFRH